MHSALRMVTFLRGASRACILAIAVAFASPGIAESEDPEFQPASGESEREKEAVATDSDVADAIIVTGSRIPRPELTAVSPVTVIQGDEVRYYGSILAEDLINALPQAFPDQGNFLSNEATGTATVNLRGLGAVRTLVLVDGRRLLPGDAHTPVPDINIVPTALIKRVEVLTGGASSVYGSDAIAGVVNFILDTDFTGFRVDGQYSFFQHDNRAGADIRDALVRSGNYFPSGNVADGGNRDVNGVFGTGFADGRGHITLYGGYRKLSALTQDRRDYSACAINGRLNSDVLDCGGSRVNAPANFVTRFFPVTGFLTIGPDRTFIPGGDLYNFAPANYWQRPGTRWTAGGFARLELGDAFEPYAELMYMRDRSVAQIAPGGNFFTNGPINCDNSLLSDQQRTAICRRGNFFGETPIFDDDGNLVDVEDAPIPFIDPVTGATYFRAFLSAGRRNVEGGPRRHDLRHKSLRLVVGIGGKLGKGWSYDAYYLTSRVDTSDTITGDFSISRVDRALDVIAGPNGQPACRSALTGEDPNCVPWDIFALGGVSPDSLDYLQLAASSGGWVRQKVANASLTGSLAEYGLRSPWADESPEMNIGVEYRKDMLDFSPDEVLASGDLSSEPFPPLPVRGGTRVTELFGEVRLPIVEGRLVDNLSFEGGYRLSKQKNADNSFTANTYKLAIDFTPVRPVRIRASYQRAVRAPNVNELFTPIDEYEFQTDPCVGATPAATQSQCAFTGVTAAQYGHILANPGAPFEGYNAIFGGNPGLEPEVATTRAIGVVLRPPFFPGLSATIDWFDIDLKGAIAFIDAQSIIDTCIATGDPFFCDRIHRDPNGSLWETPQGFVDDTYANVGGLRTSGVDVGVNYLRSFDRLGSVETEFVGTWLDKLISDNGGLATPFDCAGLYGPFCGIPAPKWRHKVRLTWAPADAVSLSLQWRHYGKVQIGFASDQVEPPRPFLPRSEWIEAQNYFDFSSLFKTRDGYILRLGVRNLFDKEPPIVLSSGTNNIFGGCFVPYCNGNTFSQIYDPLGRYFFAGVTADF